MVLWDLKAMQRAGFSACGRPAGDPLVAESEGQLGDHRHALTSKLWLIRPDASACAVRRWPRSVIQPSSRGRHLDPGHGKGLWVNTFMDGMTATSTEQSGSAQADLREQTAVR